MTDTAQDRYRKIRRTMANQWRYIKRCHNQELRPADVLVLFVPYPLSVRGEVVLRESVAVALGRPGRRILIVQNGVQIGVIRQ